LQRNLKTLIPPHTLRTCLSLTILILFLCESYQAKLPLVNKGITQTSQPKPQYKINLKLNHETLSFSGKERLQWINYTDHPTSVLYFHLYANRRTENSNAPTSSQALDEPYLEIDEVRDARGHKLHFAIDDQETTLRVNLNNSVGPGDTVEIEIDFKGRVPEISTEETGLVAHVLRQVNAVLRKERELKQARDINFSSRGVMLLGTAYPVLAVRDGDEWQRKVETSLGDYTFAEVADYDVTIETAPEIKVFASGEEVSSIQHDNYMRHRFSGQNLRDFSFITGQSLRSEEKLIEGLRIRSIYLVGHERVGQRVLNAASKAASIYVNRFGTLPYQTVNIAEAPLVAGLGSAEFSGLSVIASAFYVDFDSPAMRSVPEVVREQRSSIEDSLEFTVAHMMAHQWWGGAVGSDPERVPVLDESLANWSALYYYKEAYDEERANQVLEDQLRGVYKIYRTFGGEDMPADKPAREYRNSFQYSAIVFSKGALMFVELRRLLGDERFFAALKGYYSANLGEIVDLNDLRGAFIAEAQLKQRRVVSRTINRWLSEKRGDQDISPPDPQLALGLGIEMDSTKSNDTNAFAKVGKFFWRQMTRIR
jgi:hypothetical protein